MPSAFACSNMSNLDIVVYNTYNNYFYGDTTDFTFTGGTVSDNICPQVRRFGAPRPNLTAASSPRCLFMCLQIGRSIGVHIPVDESRYEIQ